MHTRHQKATYPVANGGIAEAHSTASIASMSRLVRPADRPILTVAIRPRNGRSRPWLLYLSAAAGRLASHQYIGPIGAPSPAEADGKTSLAADCIECASALSGATSRPHYGGKRGGCQAVDGIGRIEATKAAWRRLRRTRLA